MAVFCLIEKNVTKGWTFFISGLIIIILAAEVWSHVEIEAEDYFFPLEPVIFHLTCYTITLIVSSVVFLFCLLCYFD